MQQDKSVVESVLFINLIIFAMYIITFARNSSMFFVFFFIERVIAIQYETEVTEYIMNSSPNNINRKTIAITLGITLTQVGLFIYAFLKYPSLFIFLMVGECIDFVNIKLKKKIVERRNNNK